MDYFAKFLSLVRTPSAFFASIKQEQGYKPALYFVLQTTLIIALADALFTSSASIRPLLQTAAPQLAGMNVLWLKLFYIILTVVLVIPSSFLGAAVSHFFITIFKGTGTFWDTYKIAAYASGIQLFGIIPGMLNGLFGVQAVVVLIASVGTLAIAIWSLIIFGKALKIIHGMEIKNIVLFFVAFIAVAFIVMLLASLLFFK